MYTPPHSNPRTSPTNTMMSQHLPQHYQRTSPPGTASSNYPLLPPQFRHIHPPKSPMYRPAVLRAAHGHARSQTITPSTSPKSASSTSGSPDEYIREYKHERADSDVGSMRNGYASSSDDDTTSTLAGTETDDTDDMDFYEDDADIDKKVTGPPNRIHWKADSSSTVCDAAICTNTFSFYTRRHHCRRCGNIFCRTHASHFIPLNQHARVHPQGIPSRVCDSCFQDVRRIRARKFNASLNSNSPHNTPSPTPATVARPMSGAARPTGPGGLKGLVGSYVGSVPRDWSWSTF